MDDSISNINDNTILTEVDYTEPLTSPSEYKVDYSEGKVWFHPSLEAKKVSVDYYGLGYDMIHVNRVYTQYDEISGDVTETLGVINNETYLKMRDFLKSYMVPDKYNKNDLIHCF